MEDTSAPPRGERVLLSVAMREFSVVNEGFYLIPPERENQSSLVSIAKRLKNRINSDVESGEQMGLLSATVELFPRSRAADSLRGRSLRYSSQFNRVARTCDTTTGPRL